MIVVTGGAGFIGSNIVRGLNAEGEDRILIVDDLRDGRKHLNLAGVRFSDYADRKDFAKRIGSFGNIHAVLHQGACTMTTETDGRYMMRANFDYSKKLLDYCAAKRIPFLYASSAAVYGPGANGFTEAPGNEWPLNIYAFSKLAFDNYVRNHKKEFESQVLGLRYFNVYGPHERYKGDMASLAYKMFSQHDSGLNLTLFEGSEEFCRDFIYVPDVVKVNLYFLEAGISGLFNCGTGEARSFAELGRLVSKHLGDAPLEFVPMPEPLEQQYQTYTCSDNSCLRSAGYDKPFIRLEDGITSYMDWLVKTTGRRQ